MGQGRQIVNGKWDGREGKMEITTRGNCVFVSGGLGESIPFQFLGNGCSASSLNSQTQEN